MINWLKNLLREKEEHPILQWKTEDSILAFLRQNRDSKGALPAAAQTLPDETRADDEIKFAPGLSDAMFGADHSPTAKSRIKQLAKYLGEIAANGNEQRKSDFYREVTENESVIGIIDELLEVLVRRSLPVDPHLFDFAYDLATKTNHRNSVKFGVAILGLCQNKKPVEELKILGLHDEFTVFATIALVNLSDQLVDDLWQLAQQVDGWGRIQLVDRLAGMDLPTEVSDWLVYDGYKNSIMYEYLALTCAINGKLNDKLAAATIDAKLFRSAGEIIVAMFDEGPAAGMSAYPDSVTTIQNYLEHAKQQQLGISDFIIIHQVKEYLESIQAEKQEEDILKRWQQDDLSNCLLDCNEMLTAKDWTPDIKKALQSTDDLAYWQGKLAAQKLGLDIRDVFWKRLTTHPLEGSSWYDVTNNAKPEDAPLIIEQAMKLLPLAEIATGPENSMGIGPDFQKYQSLEFVITFLKNHPTLGEEIILAGLRSPVIRNRNVTLRTLEKWTRENWSQEIKNELSQLQETEPNTDTKETLDRLLSGQELQ